MEAERGKASTMVTAIETFMTQSKLFTNEPRHYRHRLNILQVPPCAAIAAQTR